MLALSFLVKKTLPLISLCFEENKITLISVYID